MHGSLQEFRVRQVAQDIWSIGTALGSIYTFCYLLKLGREYVLYDCGLRKTANAVRGFFEERRIVPNQLRTIIISHSHHDHIGALAELAEWAGARVYVHKLAEPWLVDHERQFLEFFGRWQCEIELDREFRRFFFDNLGRPWIADEWLDELPYEVPAEIRIDILATPGHSADGISLWLPERGVLLAADAFMGAGVGGALPQYDDWRAYQDTMAKIRKLPVELLLTGHFEPIDADLIEPAIQQSLRLTRQIHDFLLESLKKKPEGYTTGFLTRMLCARFGRTLTPQAFITVSAHLAAAAQEGVIHQQGAIWRWGRADRKWLPIMH